MVNFVIAGKPDCPKFLHVLHVAEYLNKKLPNFKYTKMQLGADEWGEWIVQRNREFKWTHCESPLIYKELHNYGTKMPQYIGGISEFWEYCFDYYGLESLMSKDDLDILISENMFNYTKDFIEKYKSMMSLRTVMIYGAKNDMLDLLVPELLAVKGLSSHRGIHFLLYDESLGSFQDNYFNEFIVEIHATYNCKVEFCDNLAEGLRDCSLVIILSDFIDEVNKTDEEKKKTTQSTKTFEPKNSEIRKIHMYYLAEEINQCAQKNLRVIFANNGLSCLGASLLVSCCKLPKDQMVVVTSDLGLPYIAEIARSLNVRVDELSGAPVWGSTGLNHFVDYGNILKKCHVRKPNLRALKDTSASSTLVQGTIFTELRFIEYLCEPGNNIEKTLEKRKRRIKTAVGHHSYFPKVNALISLLRIWYGDSEHIEPIISLGLASNGSHGIPKGLVYSQPCIFENGRWAPYATYPMDDDVRLKVWKIAMETDDIFQPLLETNISLDAIRDETKLTSYRSMTSRIDMQMDAHKNKLRKSNFMF